MPSRERTPLPHPLCAHLCSKKLYMITDGREIALEDLQTMGHEEYWCRHTFTDTGPDEGWVMYSRCTPARSCFQVSDSGKSITHRILQSLSGSSDEA